MSAPIFDDPQQSPNTARKIAAFFLDAENLHGSLKRTDLAEFLAAEFSDYDFVVRRAFASEKAGIDGLVPNLQRAGFERVDSQAMPRKRNASDVQMAVEVVDLFWQHPEIDHWVIASADADFLPLLRFLHQRGKIVICLGASGRYREELLPICNDVRTLTNNRSLVRPRDQEREESPKLSASDSSRERSAAPSARNTDSEFAAPHLDLWEILREYSRPIPVGKLKNAMLKRDPNFSQQLLGFASFSDFLRANGLRPRIGTDGTTWCVNPSEQLPAPQVLGVGAAHAPVADLAEIGPAMVDDETNTSNAMSSQWRWLYTIGWPRISLSDFVTAQRALVVAGPAQKRKEHVAVLKRTFADRGSARPNCGLILEIFKAIGVWNNELRNFDGDTSELCAVRETAIEELCFLLDAELLRRVRKNCEQNKTRFEASEFFPLLLGPRSEQRIGELLEHEPPRKKRHSRQSADTR